MTLKAKKTKPCKECPFARNNELKGENPGGSNPGVYIGQAMGPFWLPCHMEKEYNGKKTDPNTVNQCAGAAIYRSNVNAPKMPHQILRLPEDKDLVFSSHAEFYAHYKNISVKEAEEILTDEVVYTLFLKEMSDANVKRLS